MAEESRLVLSVDGSGARREISSLSEELADLTEIGEETAESFEELQEETEESARTFGDYKDAITAAVAALGAFTFARSIKETIDYYDELGKLNARFDVSVESLDNLRFMAERSGLSFKQIQNALQFMMRSVDEARNGIESYADNFRKLNLNVEEFAALSPEQQFRVLAERLQNTQDQMEKVNVAAGIFGRGAGPAMLQVLGGGVEAFDQLTANASEFTDTVSRDAAKAAEDFNDSLTNLSGSMRRLYNQIAQTVMPTLTELFNWFARLIPNAIDFTRHAFLQISARIQHFIADFAGGLAAVAEWIPGLKDLEESLIATSDKYRMLGNFFRQSAQDVLEETAAREAQVKANEELGESVEGIAQGYVEMSSNRKKDIEIIDEEMDAHLRLRDVLMKEAEALTEAARTREEVLRDDLERVEQLRAFITEETYRRSVDTLRQEYFDEIAEENEKLSREHERQMKRMERNTQQFARRFSGLITGMLEQGEFDLQRFASFFLDQFLNSMFEGMSRGPGGGGNMFASLFSGLFGGGGGGLPVGTARFAVGSDFVPQTGLALVHRGERITPAGQNVAPNVTVQVVNQGSPVAVKSETTQVDATGVITKIIIDDITRGGQVANTMEQTYGMSRGG